MTTTRAANDFDIVDDAYGRATEHVRAIVEKAKALRWFPSDTTTEEEIATARALLLQHLAMLNRAMADLATPEPAIEIVRGGWGVLGEIYRGANPVASDEDPAYARGEWRRSLGVLASALQRRVEATRASLIVPPLFPFYGKPMILNGMLTTEPARGANVVDDLPWRETIWYLMCDVDSDFWNAIMAALASDGKEASNAFAVLVDIYSRGFYPIGFVGGRFIVYHRA